jgi:hypothetical protein
VLAAEAEAVDGGPDAALIIADTAGAPALANVAELPPVGPP